MNRIELNRLVSSRYTTHKRLATFNIDHISSYEKSIDDPTQTFIYYINDERVTVAESYETVKTLIDDLVEEQRLFEIFKILQDQHKPGFDDSGSIIRANHLLKSYNTNTRTEEE